MGLATGLIIGIPIGYAIAWLARMLSSVEPNLNAYRSGFAVGKRSVIFSDLILERWVYGESPKDIGSEFGMTLHRLATERGWGLTSTGWTREPAVRTEVFASDGERPAYRKCMTCGTWRTIDEIECPTCAYYWNSPVSLVGDIVRGTTLRGVDRSKGVQQDDAPGGTRGGHRRKILTDHGIDPAHLQNLFMLNDEELDAWAHGWKRGRETVFDARGEMKSQVTLNVNIVADDDLVDWELVWLCIDGECSRGNLTASIAKAITCHYEADTASGREPFKSLRRDPAVLTVKSPRGQLVVAEHDRESAQRTLLPAVNFKPGPSPKGQNHEPDERRPGPRNIGQKRIEKRIEKRRGH